MKDTAGFSNGKPDNDAGNYWGAYDLGLHDAYLILAASNAGYDTLIMGIRDAEILRQELDILFLPHGQTARHQHGLIFAEAPAVFFVHLGEQETFHLPGLIL